MKREVLVSPRAQAEFSGLDPRTRERIRGALNEIASGKRGDVKKLRGVHGGPDLYRLRVGQHRIVFEQALTQLRVTRIILRNEEYDWL